MPRLVLNVFITIFFLPCLASAQVSVHEKYGTVILDNYSGDAGVAPVVFDHWLHRAKFTCKLCHVDIGFAMKAEATEIRAVDNINGYYCGSCHDGKRVIDGKETFAACAVKYTEAEGKRCARCHSVGRPGQRKYTFKKFTAKLPRLFGDLIDWEKAEKQNKIKPKDFLEGISHERSALKAQEDFSMEVRSWSWPDVIFSHKKHVVWNGCEVCHPLIYKSSKKGTVRYTMDEIMEGESCGVCHVSVAFSVWLCRKCHKNPVE